MKKKISIYLSLISIFIFASSFTLSSTENIETEKCLGCNDYENMSTPGAEIGDWYEGFGILDGVYYYAQVEFHDGVRGRLFQGGNSKKFFVESSTGQNYYYMNLRTAVRALYIYKKCGKHSTRYTAN